MLNFSSDTSINNKGIPLKLDRTLQFQMLTTLAQAHPKRVELVYLPDLSEEENDRRISNLLYLEGHGLVDSSLKRVGSDFIYYDSEITHDGMDFLAGDGGLGAILGVLTIKLHDDTIRDLLTAKIMASPLSQPEKTKLLDQLRELRGESIKHLTMKLLDAGLENWPAALLVIQRCLESVR